MAESQRQGEQFELVCHLGWCQLLLTSRILVKWSRCL